MIFRSDRPTIARKANVGLAGRFRMEAVSRRTGRRRVLADWFPNLILNNGLNTFGTIYPQSRCMVGTGTSTPVATQSQLDNRIASTTSATSIVRGVDLTDNYAYVRWTYRFNEGVAAGNLTEVGIGNSDTSCFSRALILDGLGEPTAITVLSDEFLDVIYELRLYPKITDTIAVVNIAGIDYDTVLRPSAFSSWGSLYYTRFTSSGMDTEVPDIYPIIYASGTLGDYTTTPTATQIASGTYSAGTYVDNSYEITHRATFSISQGNADVYMMSILSGGFGQWKMSFDPPIPKRNTNTLMLDLKLAWARKTI
jgi:hypothetical protein